MKALLQSKHLISDLLCPKLIDCSRCPIPRALKKFVEFLTVNVFCIAFDRIGRGSFITNFYQLSKC